jgi:uncharacterized repeat protein (TIGR03803 family)
MGRAMNQSWHGLVGFFLGIPSALGASQLSTLHSFGFADYSPANPCAELIQSSDGMLYGTSCAGGSAGGGTVFRISTNGADFVVLKSFGVTTNDGRRPLAAVNEGADGALYGVTEEGGNFSFGTVFRLDRSGTNFTVLKHFAGPDGAYPEARLLRASDGLLYGTTSGGGSGTNDYGVIFRIATSGDGFEVLKEFAGTNGANPAGGLIEGADGALYGTTYAGGVANLGTAFCMNRDGGSFAVLKSFLGTSQTNGYFPYGELVQGTNGALYGTTSAGGRDLGGTIYTLNTNGAGFAILRQLTNATGGAPLSGLRLASDGMLYGTAFGGGTANGGVVFRIGQDGSNYTTIANVNFGQGCAAPVLEAADGSLYGTTQLGGISSDGTIFRVEKSGGNYAIVKHLSASGFDGRSGYAGLFSGGDAVLYGDTRRGGELGAGTLFSVNAFGLGYTVLSDLASDGAANPVAALSEGTNGWLYGTSAYGGTSNRGTVFGVQKDGLGFNLLHSFTSEGLRSYASLAQSTNGLLYGLTAQGGSGNFGTLFSLQPDGSHFAVLRNFSSGGINPMQGLLRASDGKFYGTTYASNFSLTNATNGCIFRLDNDGSNYTVLKFFSNPLTTGANPLSPLLEASDGMLYGTTYSGGTTNNAGAVFRLNKDGSGFELLRAFSGVLGDPRHPCGSLVEAANGAIYGTTERGGAMDQGALFKLNKDGSRYAVLASFDERSGKYPRGGLMLGPAGALYGCTDQGGSMDCGTVFRYGAPFESIIAVSLPLPGASLTCLGLPGTNYWIERTFELGPAANWVPILMTNSPVGGVFGVVDSTSPPEQAFYRLKR